ncbi:F-box-like protein [Ceratobasidium sp. AG-Ba]|nr:F-box-like protein [Ceratobasidium sp. AG-Ba]
MNLLEVNDYQVSEVGPTLLTSWQACRAVLTSAIKGYLGACKKIELSRLELADRELGPIFEAADKELAGLIAEEEALRTARIALCATRNTSKQLAPLHCLPVELLTRIFGMAQEAFQDNPRASLPPVPMCASVSTYWRRVALSAPLLWTYVDIDAVEPNEYLDLALVRSQQHPIYLRISDPVDTTDDGGLESLLFSLEEVSPQIGVLEIVPSVPSPGYVQGVLEEMLHTASNKALSTLYIHRTLSNYPYPPPPLVWDLNSGDAGSLLQSLTVLHLKNVFLPWGSMAYRHLLDLRLETSLGFDEHSVTSLQFRTILASSPQLSTLKLSRVSITHTPDEDVEIQPVILPCLELLYIGNLDPESWTIILSLINSSGCADNMSIGFDRLPPNLANLIEDFFRGLRLATLMCSACDDDSPLWILLLIMRASVGVKSLILAWFGPIHPAEAHILTSVMQVDTSHCSVEHLFIASGYTSLTDLAFIIPAFSVKAVHLDDCTVIDQTNKDGPRDLDTLANRLLGDFPGLKLAISNVDTTLQWPCRRMFDRWTC